MTGRSQVQILSPRLDSRWMLAGAGDGWGPRNWLYDAGSLDCRLVNTAQPWPCSDSATAHGPHTATSQDRTRRNPSGVDQRRARRQDRVMWKGAAVSRVRVRESEKPRPGRRFLPVAERALRADA